MDYLTIPIQYYIWSTEYLLKDFGTKLEFGRPYCKVSFDGTALAGHQWTTITTPKKMAAMRLMFARQESVLWDKNGSDVLDVDEVLYTIKNFESGNWTRFGID